MSDSSKPINLRLPQTMHDSLKRLKAEFPQLAPATLMRLLLAAEFEKPIEDQVETVIQQLRKPSEKEQLKAQSLRTPRNTKNRIENR